ncbi:MAG: molybdopterin-dependent oxidoreductase [Fidelibacterota bacterium]
MSRRNTYTRREFLKMGTVGLGGATLMWSSPVNLFYLKNLASIDNPLGFYPNRGWEKIYRNQYRFDDSFTFICSPNCTHECRLRGFVRNGVMIRTEQNYDNHRIRDLYGNQCTYAWNPRGCSNGFTFHRRVYGSYRLKYPLIRKGWKRWADEGFPDLTKENRDRYGFTSRGGDTLERIGWDEVIDYVARATIHIARTYSGPRGKKRLLDEGYPEEMLTHWEGAGTRTIKLRGGMGLLGVIGKYGAYRFSNTLALVDHHVRNVDRDHARGGRNWSNYTWHGDQAPGFPFVHGLQASDVDFNDMRFSKLHVSIGKNLVENKRPDNHFAAEVMERGGKLVVISPEYSPSSSKADYWITIRPNTDAALLLGVSRILIDNGWIHEQFLKEFTDFPLVIRRDTLKRLKPEDFIPGYRGQLQEDGPSFRIHGLRRAEYEKIGDFVVYDGRSQALTPVTRDDVGQKVVEKGMDPVLEWEGTVKTVDGKEIGVCTLFHAYKNIHLKDYDLKTVVEITHSNGELIEQLARDIATITPACIHVGEGLNHWFHAVETNRAAYLPMILTGNIGRPGAGCHTWAGNYKAGLFQGSDQVGPGFKAWVAEDPFEPNLDRHARATDISIRGYARGEEPAYWNDDDRPLIVNTPKYGRKVFTGTTHMPTPTKMLWHTNVNLLNNAKYVYEMVRNVNPNIDLIISQDIEMTATCEYADVVLPANSWAEQQSYELTASCSNPFLQIWNGGLKPVFDSRDDVLIFAQVAARMGEILEDKRFSDYWKFALEGKTGVYIDRLLDGSNTTHGYTTRDIMAGKYGEPGAALMLFRTYPRIPFYEQVKEGTPFFTPTGRLQAYNDEPEVIEYGENFVVHREGPEATLYLPNVIVSTNPLIRPDDYGIPLSATGANERQVRNVKMAWKEVKKTKNFLWKDGFKFYCLTPKTRHATHSSWQVTDWQFIWNNPFGDPYRLDRRQPGVGEHTLYMNPRAARDLGIDDGDYVYVDADPRNRPYKGWKKDDPFYKVARLKLRLRYNPSYPYHVVMMKHGAWMATEKSVRAHETRPDGRAQSEDTGYQASFRYGSHQSVTYAWQMPMQQLDTLFHKAKARMGFLFGYEADNHAINTTPKETLVRITLAEKGGAGGKGTWAPARTGYTPANESEFMESYLAGDLLAIREAWGW